MAGKIDLHVHTTTSDGMLTPTETVQRAAANGVWLLGVADHDTTGGVREAEEAARGTAVTLVPAVELSVGAEEHEIHVLGYFVDPDDRDLQSILHTLRNARDLRNERIVSRLAELGARIDLDRVREIAGEGSVGRPHIAQALVEAGHCGSLGEAFGRFLARGKPGYVGRERLGPADAVSAIRKAGGLPVLAHPGKLSPRSRIEAILDTGLEGVEAYHTDHDERDVALVLEIARDRNLLVTGGTDSHGPHAERPIEIGALDIPAWVGEQFLARAPARWRAGA